MNTIKKEVAVKTIKKTDVKKVAKKTEAKAYSFSQFKKEYNKKTDKLSLSIVRMETDNVKTAEKMSVSFAVRPFIAQFDKVKRINDGKTKRKEALKLVKSLVHSLKSEAPRANVLRPIIETIKENYGKDYNSLLQKSFQR